MKKGELFWGMIVLGVGLMAAGCGSSSSSPGPGAPASSGATTAATSYAYQFCEGDCADPNTGACISSCQTGCTTGSHSFTTLADYCHALEDRHLNGEGCGRAHRRDLFKSAGCPDHFAEKHDDGDDSGQMLADGKDDHRDQNVSREPHDR